MSWCVFLQAVLFAWSAMLQIAGASSGCSGQNFSPLYEYLKVQ